MAEWKPEVGKRAIDGYGAVIVLGVSAFGDRVWCGTIPWDGDVKEIQVDDLRQHPDDARHRRLLEAARRVVYVKGRGVVGAMIMWPEVIADLRAILAEIDAAGGYDAPA